MLLPVAWTRQLFFALTQTCTELWMFSLNFPEGLYVEISRAFSFQPPSKMWGWVHERIWIPVVTVSIFYPYSILPVSDRLIDFGSSQSESYSHSIVTGGFWPQPELLMPKRYNFKAELSEMCGLHLLLSFHLVFWLSKPLVAGEFCVCRLYLPFCVLLKGVFFFRQSTNHLIKNKNAAAACALFLL